MKVGENMRIPEPVLNEDFYMVKRIGGDVILPTPKTRFEKLLYIYAGGTIERPTPKTIEERFLDYITGGESELPVPKTRLQSYMYNVANPSNKIPVVPPKTRFECYWFVLAEGNNVISDKLPVEFTSVDGFLLDYTIWGNSEQDGTPTPEEHVEVQSVGDKTVNLLNNSPDYWEQGQIIAGGGKLPTNDRIRTVSKFQILPNTTYTLQAWGDIVPAFHLWQANGIYISDSTWITNLPHTFTTPSTAAWIEFTCRRTNNTASIEPSCMNESCFLQLENGATATEYEPYGYKIPVTVSEENGGETTTVIYLDDPLRKIGDYVDYINFENQHHIKNVCVVNFTGEEEWGVQGNNYFTYIPHPLSRTSPTLCSAFSLSTSGSTAVGEYRLGGIDSWDGNVLFNYDNGAGVDNFKSYLAEQYTNGTPVKFYYPSVPAITELIELPKIPTFAGTNVIDMDTTVKPSKIEVVMKL